MASAHPSSTREPPSGTFDLDPARPVLLVEGAGHAQRNTIYPPDKMQTPDEKKHWQRLHHIYANRMTFPRTSVQMTPDAEIVLDYGSGSPFDVGGMLRPGDVMGPPEAFVPFTSVDASGIVIEDQSMASDTEDGVDDMDIISPFID